MTPGVAEVVLGSGADRRRELLAIHKELLVSFTPPATARIPDVQHHAAEPAAPAGLQDPPIGEPIFRQGRQIAMPLGVEMPQPCKGPRQRRMHDLITDRAIDRPVIRHFDRRPLRKRHVPVGIGPVRRSCPSASCDRGSCREPCRRNPPAASTRDGAGSIVERDRQDQLPQGSHLVLAISHTPPNRESP